MPQASLSSPVPQWIQQTGVFTYLSGTSFSVPGALTSTYAPGTSIQATVSAGTIQGFVLSSTSGGSPVTTTVVCAWQDGQALDARLSTVSLALFPVIYNFFPPPYVVTKTNDYTMTINDFGVDLLFNNAAPLAYTLLAANAVPQGFWVKIKNIGAGLLTITGTVDGRVDPTFQKYDGNTIFSDGTSWCGENKPLNVPMIGEASAHSGNDTQTLDLGIVTLGDRIFVQAQYSISGTGGTGITQFSVFKDSGSASIRFGDNQAGMSIGGTAAVSGSVETLFLSGICKITGSGSLILKSVGAKGGSPTIVTNDIYAFFLKKQ